jgi:hypothetical protein
MSIGNRQFVPRTTPAVWIVCVATAIAFACSGALSSEEASVSGFCADSCPKACSGDAECDTSQGERR